MKTVVFAGMNWWDLISIAVTIGMLIAAAILDKKTLKVPNYLTFPGFFAGIILCILSNGFGEMGLRFITIAILFLVYMTKILAGGDIKLLMALTMLHGTLGMLITLILANIVLLVWKLIQSRTEAVTAIKDGLFLINGWGSSTYSDNDARKIALAPYMLIGFVLYVGGRIAIYFIF